jgi:hypothetical protein
MTRDSTEAHLNKEVRSEAAGHMAALEPTSIKRCDPKLQLTWQRVNTCSPPYFNLELIYGYLVFNVPTMTP